MHLFATAIFFLLLAMLVFSIFFWLAVWASVEVLVHGEHRRRAKLAARSPGDDWPMVSILKPLKGRDPQALNNFASFCMQQYPGKFELLFAIADPADPAALAVRELQAQFPQIAISLFTAPPLGANPKTALLHHLSSQANGEILVISDSDVRVAPDYLQAVVQPLRCNPRVGVVTCPYCVERAGSLTSRLESLGRAAFLVPAAIFASTVLGEPVGLGATIAVRRRDLMRSGGFAAMADHLADDNRLARQIHDLGLSIYMSGEVVSIVSDGWCKHLTGMWKHEVRWCTAERVACGIPKFFGLWLTFTIALAGCALLADFWRTGVWSHWLLALAASATALRWGIAARTATLLGYRTDPLDLLLIIPRGILAPLIWMAAFTSRNVTWRGNVYAVHSNGRLTLKTAETADQPAFVLNGLTRWIDRQLREQQGIREYSHDPRCIFRISQDVSPFDARLRDGITISAGQPVLELHFWSDHMPRIADEGPSLLWARQAIAAAEFSLRRLATLMENDPAYAGITALHGTSSMISRQGDGIEKILNRLGFESIDDPRPRTLARRLHRVGEDILVWMLLRAFNPGGVGGKLPLLRPRQQVFMSRQALLRRYGTTPDETRPPRRLRATTLAKEVA